MEDDVRHQRIGAQGRTELVIDRLSRGFIAFEEQVETGTRVRVQEIRAAFRFVADADIAAADAAQAAVDEDGRAPRLLERAR